MHRSIPVLVLASVLAASLGAAPPRTSAAERARLLHRWAEDALVERSIDGRARAARNLEEAIRLEPANPEHWMLLGRVKLQGEYDREALDCFRRAVVIQPRHLEGWVESAQSWKREWLRTLDTLALTRAIGCLDTATRVVPGASAPWLQLAALRYERANLDGAADAAARAVKGRPRRAESRLAVAYLAYRRGEGERADSLFRASIPDLDPGLRRLFDHPSAMLGAAAGADGRWDGLDPDPTTRENELQLEYWSRLVHAVLIFHDPARPGLDARAESYIRFGPPQSVENNPAGVPLFTRASEASAYKPQLDFPVHVMAWHYPELGMRRVLQDRSLHGNYQLAATRDFDASSLPDPRVLAARKDLVSLGGGVFPTLPPLGQRIGVHGIVARFAGGRGGRLVAQVEAAGTPADSLHARWIVTDASGRALARGAQDLAVAACDPAERRQAQFAAELPSGAYDVSISVQDARRRRGLFRTRAVLEPARAGLSLSDLVLACGDAAVQLSDGTARFDANVERRVSGDQLVAYLEINHLTKGTDGLARFEYRCEVRRVLDPKASARDAPDPAPLVSISREESYAGGVRRQFVSVPIRALAPGRYRLVMDVNDLVAGMSASRATEFERD